MARAAKLKVYRTAAGFHDAYVAAPSQKAALAAWGSEHDLFARGIAELVTDPELTAAPLAAPGVVIKRSRGSAAEQIASLPDRKPTRPIPADAANEPKSAPKAPKPRPKPRPKPTRTAVEHAEAALEAVQREHGKQRRALAEREAALARERRSLEREQDVALRAAQTMLDTEQAAFDRALSAWRAER
ncbi:hypothetical protein U1701_12340 [Sphingomonas sp. PB2P19]|uniref:hypothetical protein n=1 Tax=Sphingomonas rhamnosi TaxID=3096156 RepID=UPI002FCAB7CE